jgi:hypothetical protein
MFFYFLLFINGIVVKEPFKAYAMALGELKSSILTIALSQHLLPLRLSLLEAFFMR